MKSGNALTGLTASADLTGLVACGGGGGGSPATDTLGVHSTTHAGGEVRGQLEVQ